MRNPKRGCLKGKAGMDEATNQIQDPRFRTGCHPGGLGDSRFWLEAHSKAFFAAGAEEAAGVSGAAGMARTALTSAAVTSRPALPKEL